MPNVFSMVEAEVICIITQDCTQTEIQESDSLRVPTWSSLRFYLGKFQQELSNAYKFHQPRLEIRTFHHQERCSRGGHLCNEHSEEKYSCSYK